jgi:hypothetical protein
MAVYMIKMFNFRQFKFFNPRGVDYSSLNQDRPRPKIE